MKGLWNQRGQCLDRVILVTGAGGSIGREVVKTLASRRWQAIGIGHGDAADLPLKSWIRGEITSENLNALIADCGPPDGVIHLAGGSSVGPSLAAPVEDFTRTVSTAVKLLEWVRQASPDSPVVLASSAAVYGEAGSLPLVEETPRRPTSPYGFHKFMMELTAESYAASFGIQCATVRPFSVYGPGLRKQLIWEACSRLKGGAEELVLGGTGHETRDWLHISDAAMILIDALEVASDRAPAINACTGIGLSIADTAAALIEGFQTKATARFTGEVRRGDPAHLVGDPTKSNTSGLAARVAPIEGLIAMARQFSQT